MSGFEKHSQADIVLLEKWIQFEAEEAQNDSKEAILLLDTHLIEQTFVYCVKFNTTPLAKHASVCLLATYLRAYYQCKNPSINPYSPEMQEIILCCILISSKFHDGKQSLIARDLLDLWPKSSGNKCKSVVMKEYQILQLLDYKVWLKGCIPLRIVHYCLQHYSISLMLRTHELVLLENISIAIVEQIHQFKDILCWDNLELALSVVLASVALAGQNNFRLSSDNKQWLRRFNKRWDTMCSGAEAILKKILDREITVKPG